MEDNFGCSIALWAAGIAALICAVTTVVAIPSYYSDRAECSYAARNSGEETRFVKNHLLSWDCYVRVDGRWVPIDKWRGDSES